MRKIFVSSIAILVVVFANLGNADAKTTAANSPPESQLMMTVAGSDYLTSDNSSLTITDCRIVIATAANFSLKILDSNTAENVQNLNNQVIAKVAAMILKESDIFMPLKYPLISPTQMNKTSFSNGAAMSWNITNSKNPGFKVLKNNALSATTVKINYQHG